MNPFVAIGAAIGYLAAPRLVSKLSTASRPNLSRWCFPEEKGAALRWRGLSVEVYKQRRGGDA